MRANNRNQFGQLINDMVRSNSAQLEALCKKTQANIEKIDPAIIDNWKTSLVELSKEYASLTNQVTVTSQLLDAEIGSRRQRDANSTFDDKQIEKRLKEQILQQCSTYDPVTNQHVNKVITLLKLSEEDVEIMNDEITESDFKCPYTKTRMEIVMKNSGCRHRMSKLGLDSLFKNQQPTNRPVKCPVAACSGHWTPKTVSRDVEHEALMKKFFEERGDQQGRASSSSSSAACDMVNINEDAEYTQL